MIVEERTYHVHTGKLRRSGARSTPRRAPAIQQRVLGNLIGAFTVDIGDLSSIVQLWGYESLDERERRRARAAGRRRHGRSYWRGSTPLIHTQRNRILIPTSFSPLR